MSAARGLAARAWLLVGAVVVFLPILREIVPAGTFRAGLSTAQFLALELGLALVAVFLRQAARTAGAGTVPAGGPARVLARVLAGVLAAVTAGAGAWLVVFLATDRAVFLPPDGDLVAVAVLLIGATLVACLLAGGRPVALVAAGVVALGYLWGFGGSAGAAPPVTSYLSYLVYGADGLLGRALDIMVNPVLAFVVFGALFDASGGGRAISDLALRLAARSRAGAIKACILASGMFGAISGTAIANVMTTGAFSIPGMRRIGVRNDTAAGIEAAASTSGQVMPPVMGAAAFLLADFSGETYGRVALASLLPALGVYLAMFRQADRVAFALSEPEASEAREIPRAHAAYLLPPAVLVALLVLSEAQPDRAALAGALSCLAVSFMLHGARESLSRLARAMEALLSTGLQLVVIAGSMGLILGVLNATGAAVAVTLGLGGLGQGSLALALVVAGGAAFVLGMGMATVGVYVIAGAMLAPGLIEAGVPPLAAHMFVLYCGLLSMLSPPVALASLAASALAQADFGATARAGLRFGWILFAMPVLIVVQPGLVLVGGAAAVVQAVVTSGAFILAATTTAGRRRTRAGLVLVAAAAALWPGGGWAAVALALGVVTVLAASVRRGPG